jgi:hypothetical protein
VDDPDRVCATYQREVDGVVVEVVLPLVLVSGAGMPEVVVVDGVVELVSVVDGVVAMDDVSLVVVVDVGEVEVVVVVEPGVALVPELLYAVPAPLLQPGRAAAARARTAR